MVAVARWTGVEIKALLDASRSTQVQLGDRLGISERMVSTWVNRGADVVPRQANQDALDTILAQLDPADLRRFIQATLGLTSILYEDSDAALVAATAARPVRRHAVDGRAMTLVDQGVYLSGSAGQPVWLAAFWIDVYPVTNA